MYLMYVDESGDCGTPSDGSPSRYFCLSGVVVHELRWTDTILELTQFRHWLRRRFGVFLEAELHASDMISKPSRCHVTLQNLRKFERLAILRQFADKLTTLNDLRVINVVVDKHGKAPNKDEVFRWAWYSLFQRFENTIRRRNFPGPANPRERGMIFPDNTDGGKLKRFLSRMRSTNQLKVKHPGGHMIINQPLRVLIEDPVMRDSRESYLIQAADCAAFLLKQSIDPSSFMRKHGGNAYFHRLRPVLCTHASLQDPTARGIVWL